MAQDAQQSDVMDALHEIQRTQALLLEAIEALPAKANLLSTGSLQPAIPVALPTSLNASGTETSANVIPGLTGASSEAIEKDNDDTSPETTATSPNSRPAFTSRIILTFVT